MKAELQKILGNWDYAKGLEWYKEHVQGKFFLKELFSRSADSYNNQKLRQELNDICQSLPDEHPTVAPPPKKKDQPQEKPLLKLPKESIENLKIPEIVERAAGSPEEMQLDQEWKPLYREAMFRRNQLSEDMTDEERKPIAFEVLNLMDQVQAIWQKKDFLKKYGVMPDFENQGHEALTPHQMHTRIRTLRTYISKAKKGQGKAERIPEWEAEMQELERRVKG